MPARYGGEEFAILLPHTSDEDAAILAERIRRTIENHPFPVYASAGSGIPLRFTVSIGVAAMTPECVEAGRLLAMADTAMYRAKQGGRNRTAVFRSGEDAAAAVGPAA